MSTQEFDPIQKHAIESAFREYLEFVESFSGEYSTFLANERERIGLNIEYLSSLETAKLESIIFHIEGAQWLNINSTEQYQLLYDLISWAALDKDFENCADCWVDNSIRYYFRLKQIYLDILAGRLRASEVDFGAFYQAICEFLTGQDRLLQGFIIFDVRLQADISYCSKDLTVEKWPLARWSEILHEKELRTYPLFFSTLKYGAFTTFTDPRVLSKFPIVIGSNAKQFDDMIYEKTLIQAVYPYDVELSEVLLIPLNPCNYYETSIDITLPAGLREERIRNKVLGLRDDKSATPTEEERQSWVGYEIPKPKHDLAKDKRRELAHKLFISQYSRFNTLMDKMITIFAKEPSLLRNVQFANKLFLKAAENEDEDVKFLFLWAAMEALAKRHPNQKWHDSMPRDLALICRISQVQYDRLINLLSEVFDARAELTHGDYEYDFKKFEDEMSKRIPDFGINYFRHFVRFLIFYFSTAIYVLTSQYPQLSETQAFAEFFKLLEQRSETGLKAIDAKIRTFWAEQWSFICLSIEQS